MNPVMTMVMTSVVKKQLPRCRASFASIAFQMLENQSQLNIDRVFDESRPYMTKSMNRKVEELSIVCRAARSLSAVSRGMGIDYQNCDFSSESSAPDTLTIAVVVAKVFKDANIPYAIGGALACGVWSVPRGTMDVNMNVFVLRDSTSSIRDVLDLLENNGVLFCDKNHELISKETCLTTIRDGSDLNGMLGLTCLDIFFSNDSPSDLTLLAKQRRELVDIGTEKISFLSAESIAIFKLLSKKSKDVGDLEKLFCTQRSTLDFKYIESILLQQEHEDDESKKLFYLLKRQYAE